MSRTLFDKIWEAHVVRDEGLGFSLLHVDRHLIVDLNGNAFAELQRRGLKVRNPELTFATPDHAVSSSPVAAGRNDDGNRFLCALREGTATHGIRMFDLGQPGHGIVHVTGPEMGLILPGMTVTVGDSHTTTNGALGALAWGVGQGELVHILATQTTRLLKPEQLRITLSGSPGQGTTAKDIILALIGHFGARTATGQAIELAGPAMQALEIEERFTVCNMLAELGARFGLVAPDDKVFAYLKGRPFAPKGVLWDQAMAHWRGLVSDEDAQFERELSFDVEGLPPQLTWGNSVDAVVPIDGDVPAPDSAASPSGVAEMRQWLDYMGLSPGEPLLGKPIDRVFIGSCTNSRLSDLRGAADMLRGRKVADHVLAWAVPGSQQVKAEAEAEGLDRIFREAGFDWRTPACSMCVGTNGEIAKPGQRVVSTSNRNFAGRQGPGVRTHLASPLVAAASAIAGRIADPREYL